MVLLQSRSVSIAMTHIITKGQHEHSWAELLTHVGDHVGVHGLCCFQRPHSFMWVSCAATWVHSNIWQPVQPQRTVLMLMAIEDHGKDFGTCWCQRPWGCIRSTLWISVKNKEAMFAKILMIKELRKRDIENFYDKSYFLLPYLSPTKGTAKTKKFTKENS